MKTITALIFSLIISVNAFALASERNGVAIITTSARNGIATTCESNSIQILDPDANTYFNAVVSAGSTIDTTARNAVNAFTIGCKQDSIWTLLLDVGPVCGSSLTGALVKLKDFGVGASYTNNNFVSGDYSQSTGITGNGSTKYLNTGITTNSFTISNVGIAFYDRTTANGTRNMNGCQVNADGTRGFYVQVGPTNTVDSQICDVSSVVSTSALSGPVGFIHGTRNSSPLHSVYRNGTSLASTSTVGGTLPTLHFYWFAWNLSGTAGLFSTHTMSFLAITAGMNSTQAGNLYTRVQALQTALGRQVWFEHHHYKTKGIEPSLISDLALAA